MRERYSIEVTEESVEIYGELTIEETFDFLSFFERKGYKSVILGTENSTLHLLKKDPKETIVDQRITDLKDEVTDYKRWLEKEQDAHAKTTEKLKDVEILMKSVMSEEFKKYKALYDENQKNLKYQQLLKLKQDPTVKVILSDMGIMTAEQEAEFEKQVLMPDGPGTQVPYPFDWTYPKQEPIPDHPPEGAKDEAH